jgi:hypothetical protein
MSGLSGVEISSMLSKRLQDGDDTCARPQSAMHVRVRVRQNGEAVLELGKLRSCLAAVAPRQRGERSVGQGRRGRHLAKLDDLRTHGECGEELHAGSIGAMLATYGVESTRKSMVISARLADQRELKLLREHWPAPILSVESQYVDQRGKPVDHGVPHYAENRIDLQID